jgi:hypothetical protein
VGEACSMPRRFQLAWPWDSYDPLDHLEFAAPASLVIKSLVNLPIRPDRNNDPDDSALRYSSACFQENNYRNIGRMAVHGGLRLGIY